MNKEEKKIELKVYSLFEENAQLRFERDSLQKKLNKIYKIITSIQQILTVETRY